MEPVIYNSYIQILKQELIPALGCTEPISIALAAAKARELLGEFPERAEILCSGNVIKNVKGVIVPNSGGQKGLLIAAALGIAGGEAQNMLEVLTPVTDQHREIARQMVERGDVVCRAKENVDNLYVDVTVTAGTHSAQAVIAHSHANFVRLVQNGNVLLEESGDTSEVPAAQGMKELLNVADIYEFAKTVEISDVKDILERQIEMNTAISDYGLTHDCGAHVGQTLLKMHEQDICTRAKARAAAGSDARMNGCTLPVVINSGSGNQGMTVSLPVIEYADHIGADRETLYRALVLSNLIAIHQKRYIGNLSAFCGAVSAACGAGAAITYLNGAGYEEICRTITNTEANVSGIICDGAKASCAAKIAAALDAAFLAHEMSMQGYAFPAEDGIVKQDVESTMQSVGYVAKHGMQATDREILRIMTDEVKF